MALTVVAFWGNDKFHVAEATPDLASIPNRAFRAANPEGAALAEKDIANGMINEEGVYRFIEDESGTLLGYEKLNDI